MCIRDRGQVENFITQGMDAIVLIAANTDATDPMTQAAVDLSLIHISEPTRPY